MAENDKNKSGFFVSKKITAVCIFFVAVVCFVSVCISSSKTEDNIVIYQAVTTSSSTLPANIVDTITDSRETSSSSKTAKSTFKSKISTTKKSETTRKNSYNFPADINLVTKEQLMAIDGIGKSTAQKIIDYRNRVGLIRNLMQLTEIDGIGESTIQLLSQYLYVSDNDYEDMPSENNQWDYNQNNNNNFTDVPETIQNEENVRRPVNINTASAEEISECLLIDMELAQKIIDLRNQISYFSDFRELLYVDGISENFLNQIKDYILK